MAVSRKQLEALAWKHTARKDRTSLAGKPAVFVMRPCGPTALVLSEVPKAQLVAWLPARVQRQVAQASASSPGRGRAAGRSREPRNDEGFTFERWLKVAGLDASDPGAFGAWRKGEDPRRVMRSGRAAGKHAMAGRADHALVVNDIITAHGTKREMEALRKKRGGRVWRSSSPIGSELKQSSGAGSSNANGLTFQRWLDAAGLEDWTREHRRAWQAGEDPAEHHPRARPKGRSFGSHILAFLGGYGVARAVDHPDHVKRAASAVGRGARKTVDEAKKLGRTARDAAKSTKSSYKGGSEPAPTGASGGRSSLAVGVLSPRAALPNGTKRWSLTVEVNGKHVGGTDFSSATAKSAQGFSKLLLRGQAESFGAARWKLVDRKGAELAAGAGKKR